MNYLIDGSVKGCGGLPGVITDFASVEYATIDDVLFIVLAFGIISFFLIAILFQYIGKCFVMRKLGEKWWKGLIPVYSNYMLFKKFNLTAWFWPYLISLIVADFIEITWLAFVIDLVMHFCLYLLYYYISRAFGHKTAFFVGLAFLSPIFWFILGINNDEFNKDMIYVKETKEEPINKEIKLCPKCKLEIEEGDKFCKHCGKDLTKKSRKKKEEN